MTQAVAQNLLTTEAGVGQWVLNGPASTVRIAHKTLWGLVTVKGAFTRLAGSGSIEPGGKLAGTLSIDAASIDTKNKKRDTHLRSAEFFDVEQYPQITVGISSATIVGDEVRLQAELTVKGIREPLPLTARISETTKNAVAVTVETKVDRDRFGMSWNQMSMIKGLTTVTVPAVFSRSV